MTEIKGLTYGPKHHFYGYYGINPWDQSLQYHLALETDFHERRPDIGDIAVVGLVDRDTNTFIPYGKTSTFNLQQGSMMHWINAGFGEEFTFNDWEGEKLVSRTVNLKTRQARTINGAIAAVSPAEPIAIGLNYGRMAHCRPVVGYANDIDPGVFHPEDDGLFLLNLKSGDSSLILSIADVIRASQGQKFPDGLTWFNHVLFNTDGARMLFFCRIKVENGFISSLWTVNPDGSGLECQIPFGNIISHFAWRDERRILISSNVAGGMQFLEFTDRKQDFQPFGKGSLPQDGHASFSPDREWVVTDANPRGPERLAELMLYNIDKNHKVVLGKFHQDKQFTGDIRCDLHPRWSPDGKTITFDSIHEGTRQIYIADVSQVV